MKKLLIILPFLLNAENFNDLVKLINNSNTVKIYQKNVEIQKQKLNQAKAKNYGKLDFEYDYSHLFNNPVMKMNSPQPVAAENAGSAPLYPLVYKSINSQTKVGKKDNFVGMLTYSYPVFTGFAISNAIDIGKLNLIKSKLNLENIKRNLIINTAKLYAGIYALKEKIKALNEAKKALLSAKNQASALYKEGLLNKSTLDEIDAKYYEITADIDETKANKKTLFNNLDYMLNVKVFSVNGLPQINLKHPNIFNRPDVKAIKKTLKITKKVLNIAKSGFFPKIYFQAGIKKEANNVFLNHNNYQNIDKSFVALSFQYNIFNGGEDKAKIEEAKISKMKTYIFFKNYIDKVKTEYQNDLLTLNALKKRFFAAKKEVKARKSYYEYIRAKFNEGLADVTDLNSAIAKLADVEAKRDYIKSQIFFYILKSNIDGGNGYLNQKM